MSKSIYQFKHSGNDSFIDFLKGISIILVLLSHTIPHDCTYFPIWGGSKAVPIFLTIQIFHAYKKGKPRIPDLKKILKRVISPFLLFQGILLSIILVNALYKNYNITEIINSTLITGGNGPGTYYIYIYIQFALILPFIYKCLNKYNTLTIFLSCLAFSFLNEIIASHLNLSDHIYRLLATRYIFLIFFGFLWVRNGIVIGFKEFILGILGFISVIYLRYFYEPLEPIFFDTGWKTDRWISFFYVMYIYVPLLFIIWKNLKDKIKAAIQFLGVCSFEIFLMQMFMCVIITPNMINRYVCNDTTSLLIHILIVITTSICGGLLYYKIKNRSTKK